MTASIICTIGDELLDGRILNKHHQSLGKFLFNLGYPVKLAISLPDQIVLLTQHIYQYAQEAKILILTGGLGPTTDDCTREAVANALGYPLYLDTEALESIEIFFKQRRRKMAAINQRQAYFPKGSLILNNPLGTAPGFYLNYQHCHIFCLPGVPFEMSHMLEKEVRPLLLKKLNPPDHFENKVYKCFGIGESSLGELIEAIPNKAKELQILYRAHFPELHIALRHPVTCNINKWHSKFSEIIQNYCFSQDPQESYVDYFAGFLIKNSQKLILVESCTGGLLSQLLTEKAGATAYFEGALVTYSNTLKQQLCDVKESSLQRAGAVSESVALEMAKGALEKHKQANLSISITGIAGPSGATENKVIGTVCIAVCSQNKQNVQTYTFSGSRKRVQTLSAYTAIQQCLNLFKT